MLKSAELTMYHHLAGFWEVMQNGFERLSQQDVLASHTKFSAKLMVSSQIVSRVHLNASFFTMVSLDGVTSPRNLVAAFQRNNSSVKKLTLISSRIVSNWQALGDLSTVMICSGNVSLITLVSRRATLILFIVYEEFFF